MTRPTRLQPALDSQADLAQAARLHLRGPGDGWASLETRRANRDASAQKRKAAPAPTPKLRRVIATSKPAMTTPPHTLFRRTDASGGSPSAAITSGHGGRPLVDGDRRWHEGGGTLQTRTHPPQWRAAQRREGRVKTLETPASACPHALCQARQSRTRPLESTATTGPATMSRNGPVVRDVSAGGVVYRRANGDGAVRSRALSGDCDPGAVGAAQGHARERQPARRSRA